MRKSKPKNMRDHASQLADRLAPHVESAREKAAPMIADARTKAAPLVADARTKAAPLVAEAREKTAPALNEAKDRFTHEVLPVLTAAVAAANEATEEVREEARKRGLATAAALKGELEAPAPKKHRLRTVLVLLGLGGIAAFVMKKLSDREATTAWQSSYQPKPPTSTDMGTGPSAVDETPIATAAAGTAAGTADDEAASSPDEAVADAAETPHVPSTPDNPADEIDVDKRV